jgi:alpha-amylase
MKTVYLNFLIHQPYRLNHFPFFKIGSGKEYFNESLNASILKDESYRYLKLNRHLLQLIRKHSGKFKLNFCISGTALDQFVSYAPEMVKSLRALSKTGSVEFVGTTHGNSFAALASREEFAAQVKAHSKKIEELFGMKPKVFLLPKCTFTEVIEEILFSQGFEKIIFGEDGPKPEMETANHVFKSPNHEGLYLSGINKSLSDPLNILVEADPKKAFPPSPEEYLDRILSLPETEPLAHLNLNYAHFGRYLQKGIKILEFWEKLVKLALERGIRFEKLSSLDDQKLGAQGPLIPNFHFHSDQKDKELHTYLGNYLQQEAFSSLYGLEDQIKALGNPSLLKAWLYLQSIDHFYYMNTDYPNSLFPSPIFSPYENPFQAFITFMNVLTDLKIQVEKASTLRKSRFQDLPYSSKTILQESKPQNRSMIS